MIRNDSESHQPSASARIIPQSRTGSSGFLVSGWAPGETGELEFQLPQDFCGKTMEAVRGSPSKKIFFFSSSPESLLATTRWPKSLRTLATRLVIGSSIKQRLRNGNENASKQ